MTDDLRRRALKILDRAPDVPPDSGDELYELPPEERDRHRDERRDPWWYLPAAVVMCAALAFFLLQSIILIAF